MHPFLDDGDQQIGRDCDPDLRLDGILTGAEERLDAQVLLDPVEEQLDLRTLLVQRADGKRGR